MSDRSSGTTIHRAAERGDVDAIRRFVEETGVDVDCKDYCGKTPLIIAVLAGSPEIHNVVRYLVSKKADVEATVGVTDREPHYHRYTALILASLHGNLQVVGTLLEEGAANVNYSLWCGRTALCLATASRQGHQVVPILLQYGANSNPTIRQKTVVQSPLMNACSFTGAANIVQLLLEHGADVDAEADNGDNVMHIAASYSDEATIRLLVAHGCNVNCTTNANWAPIAYATASNNVSAFATLMEYNAKVDITSTDGTTILHLARNAESLSVLLDHCRYTMTAGDFGRFVVQENKNGNIALHTICSVEMAQLLIEQPRRENGELLPECQAQLVSENACGLTPRDLASKKCITLGEDQGYREITTYLETFECLPLAVPGAAMAFTSSGRKRQKTVFDACVVAVKTNPELSNFQQSVAKEAFDLVMYITSLPDCIVYAILGHLSTLDVMKRTTDETY